MSVSQIHFRTQISDMYPLVAAYAKAYEEMNPGIKINQGLVVRGICFDLLWCL